MYPQFYKVVNIHTHEISGWIFNPEFSMRFPHIGGMEVDVQFDLDNLELKNGEEPE